MARRVPPTDQAQAPATGAVQAATQVPAPTLPGGAEGVIPTASRKIHHPGVPESYAAPAPPLPEGAEVPKVKRYVVRNCPKPANGTHGFRIVLNGTLAWLADGKVVDSTTYDVEGLKRQGVDLEFLGEF